MDTPGDASGSFTANGDLVNMVKASQNTQQQPNIFVEPQSISSTQ